MSSLVDLTLSRLRIIWVTPTIEVTRNILDTSCMSVLSSAFVERSPNISIMFLTLPSLLNLLIPSLSHIAFCFLFGLMIFWSAIRSVVPAIDAWIPALPMIPIIASVSSIPRPAALATGAAYCIASAVIIMSVLNLVNVVVRLSASFLIALASLPIPNAVWILVSLSAVISSSLSPIRATSAIGRIELLISFTPRPAIAMNLAAPATSGAVNFVSIPT